MNYEKELKHYISYCGSYCRTCDWFTGKIKNIFKTAYDMLETYGFKKFLGEEVDIENFKLGLKNLSNVPVDPGCKMDLREIPDEDRCQIRQCCSTKGFDLCNECSDFPCDLLKNNPGVIKFGCIENLKEIKEKGLEHWIDKQYSKHLESM